MPDQAALIGVDWGTTSFRAFLLDASGEVLARTESASGILSVTDGDFAKVLSNGIGKWLSASKLPVIMSGMIGSRQGWIEAPYMNCPAGLADLAAGLVEVAPGTHLGSSWCGVVPGVATASDMLRDVMRGEETQVFGALSRLGVDSGRFLLPGTHSKWVEVSGGKITAFSTYMTGEIYAACRQHTILGRLMQEGGHDSPQAFARGVRDGARPGTSGALLHRLFGVRTLGLFNEIAGEALADYLSGLLIGAELSDAGLGGSLNSLRIIASDALARRYQQAAAELGYESEIMDPDSVSTGHLAIARAAALMRESPS